MDSSIKNIIKICSFELVAIYRLTEIHLKIIGKFNLQTSNEIIDLEKENFLDKIIQIERIYILRYSILRDLKLSLDYIMHIKF